MVLVLALSYFAYDKFVLSAEREAALVDAWLGLGESQVLLPIWEFDDAKAPQQFEQARVAFRKISEIAGAKRFELKTVDVIEEFVRTGKPSQTPDWLHDPNLIDLYYSSFVLVCAGQYEQALDLTEQVSTGNIPYSVVIVLRSVLFQEKMGHIPRYQELVTRLTTVEPDKD